MHDGRMNDIAASNASPKVSVARNFTRHLTQLLRTENGALVSFLLALAECDGRRFWADLGYASLFDYLHRELELSKSSAWYRAAGAALILRYPAIADALTDGRLCVSTLGEIRKVITPDNAAEILPRFFHCSAREAKEIAVAIAPAEASPRQDLITRLRSVQRTIPARADPSACSVVQTSEPSSIPLVQTSEPASTAKTSTRVETRASVIPEADGRHVPESNAAALRAVAPPPPPEEMRPLTAELRRLHVTVTQKWVVKLQAAKDALSHSIPSGSTEEVLEAALDALLEREAKRKGLLVKNSRKQRVELASGASHVVAQPLELPPVATMAQAGAPKSDSGSFSVTAQAVRSPKRRRKTVPAHVRREVLKRDGEKCQARLHDGTICGSTVRLQLDHVVPVALGGPPTIENIRVLCERPEGSPRFMRRR